MASPSDPRSYDLEGLRARVLPDRGGRVDDSIPQLSDADPDLCAIALALPDGDVRSTSQSDVAFSLQSAVKPFLFALALLDTDGEALDRVGIEPTGEAFDALKLESGTGRPAEPHGQCRRHCRGRADAGRHGARAHRHHAQPVL